MCCLLGSLLLGSHAGLCVGAVSSFPEGGYGGFFRDGMLRSGSGSGAAALSRQMQFVTVSYTGKQ